MKIGVNYLTGYDPAGDGRKRIAPLAIMGLEAGFKGLGNMLFGGGKDKEAKVDARNQTKLLADKRAMDQKALDRRRKILQGLRKFYSMGDPGTATGGGYLSKYGLDASRFGSIFGDLGADVGAEAYYLPQSPTLEAAKGPSWFQRLGQGLYEGATDYLNSPAQPPQMYPQGGGPMSPGQPVGASSIAGSGGIRRTAGMYPVYDDEQRA